ncbi:hypothetical protein L1987_20471 [Smallanthus sonchifolius]|uniref:Uncharacterized protein n=1 Tax=Smallanthus sonchifolius TaxID=185202 RepID=A0ACB9IRI6_9ASTR|nr:hypothetical protein L1987_20471 [Smallanthus sonchifolius]
MCLNFAKPWLPADIRDAIFITCYDASKERITEKQEITAWATPNKAKDRLGNPNHRLHRGEKNDAMACQHGPCPTLTRAVSKYRRATN